MKPGDQIHTPGIHVDQDADLIAGRRVIRLPGWRCRSEGTSTCPLSHAGYVVSGTIHADMDDGAALEAGPGEAYLISPGHVASVLGDEPLVTIEFEPDSFRI
jgi:hypothetical protein